jgi:hypothetical protein
MEPKMPRSKRVQSRPTQAEYFVFEIQTWEPDYSLSVNHSRLERDPYWEHTKIGIGGICIWPKNLVGRTAHFDLVGKRDQLTPDKDDPDWKPRCVGELDMRQPEGRFYTFIPNDSMTYLLSGLAHGQFRIIEVYGPTLKRGKSLCTSIDLKQTINLEEYGC